MCLQLLALATTGEVKGGGLGGGGQKKPLSAVSASAGWCLFGSRQVWATTSTHAATRCCIGAARISRLHPAWNGCSSHLSRAVMSALSSCWSCTSVSRLSAAFHHPPQAQTGSIDSRRCIFSQIWAPTSELGLGRGPRLPPLWETWTCARSAGTLLSFVYLCLSPSHA